MKKFITFALCCALTLVCSCKINVSSKKSKNEVKITYKTEHGVAPAAIKLEKGYVLTLNELPPLTCKGYEFDGWYDGIQKAEANVYIAQKDATLVANWIYNSSEAISNLKAAGSNGNIKLTWTNPSSDSFTGVVIKATNASTEESLSQDITLPSSEESYDFSCENFVNIKFEVTTLQMEKPEAGYAVSTVYCMAIDDYTYFVSSAGSASNDGKTLSTPLNSINTAYSKINSINDGTSVYRIILLTDLSEGGSLTDSTEYSLYYINPTKELNLVIESLDGSNKSIHYSSNYGRVFYLGAKTNVTFNNVTVKGGSSSIPDFRTFSGGGILVFGKLYMNNCIVSNNSISTYTYKANSATRGGGIYIESTGYCNLVNTDILNNKCHSSMSDGGNPGSWTAYAYGGGICNAGTLVMTGGKISGNKASKSGSGGASGNGVYTYSGASSTFENVVNEDDN